MENNLVLKTDNNDSDGEDDDMAYLTKRFQKMVRRNGGIPKRGSSSQTKATKRNQVPDKQLKRKDATDNIVKQALTAWGDSSSESEEDDDQAKSDNDEDDDDDDEVHFLDVQRNLKSYSPKKLMSLANVLIDAYHSLINDKDVLTMELREVAQSRDDLVVVVVDLKETIESLKKEKMP
uniref:Protein BFR2-like n=1 Tax=Nicotiana tabacum TaxID=4097 RepID=A0A1S4D0Y3_TOBAC|nr:PREDICTED: protein BFR2-like [Nicotiana tabacum]